MALKAIPSLSDPAWERKEDPRWGEMAYRLKTTLPRNYYAILPTMDTYNAYYVRDAEFYGIDEDGNEVVAGYFGRYLTPQAALNAIRRHHDLKRHHEFKPNPPTRKHVKPARKSNPGPPSLVRSRPHKDFMGRGTLYLVSTSRGNVYFMRYEGLRPVSEGGQRDRGVIGRFMSMSSSGDLTNQDVPQKIVREIEGVLLENRVDLDTPPN